MFIASFSREGEEFINGFFLFVHNTIVKRRLIKRKTFFSKIIASFSSTLIILLSL